MVTVLRAIVEGRSLRLLQEVPLAEGQEVQVLLYSPAEDASPRLQAWLDFLRDMEPLSGEQLQLMEQAPNDARYCAKTSRAKQNRLLPIQTLPSPPSHTSFFSFPTSPLQQNTYPLSQNGEVMEYNN